MTRGKGEKETWITGEDGFLKDPLLWDRNIAAELANEEGIILTERHYDILHLLRKSYLNGEMISIRTIKRSGLTSIREFYALFGDNPLKKAARISGIPKPPDCV